jgi:hypothetical protein
MSRDMTKSAGTIARCPPIVNHQGAVTQRERNAKRVRRPSSIGSRKNDQDQSRVAWSRQDIGRWLVEWSTRAGVEP